MYDVGSDLIWLAEARSESLTLEEKGDIRAAMVSVAAELTGIQAALFQQDSGGSKVNSIEVISLRRSLDEFIEDPAWNGLPFPEGDGGEVVREEADATFFCRRGSDVEVVR